MHREAYHEHAHACTTGIRSGTINLPITRKVDPGVGPAQLIVYCSTKRNKTGTFFCESASQKHGLGWYGDNGGRDAEADLDEGENRIYAEKLGRFEQSVDLFITRWTTILARTWRMEGALVRG